MPPRWSPELAFTVDQIQQVCLTACDRNPTGCFSEQWKILLAPGMATSRASVRVSLSGGFSWCWREGSQRLQAHNQPTQQFQWKENFPFPVSPRKKKKKLIRLARHWLGLAHVPISELSLVALIGQACAREDVHPPKMF